MPTIARNAAADTDEAHQEIPIADLSQLVPIPGPAALPGIGNLLNMQGPTLMETGTRLREIYGPIYRLRINGVERVFIGDQALWAEVNDEKRFWKMGRAAQSGAPLDTSKAQGLFFAHSEREQDWQVAHRILMPCFGPLGIETMFDDMFDIATQLILKWARMPDMKILATNDFTRLTLDTIALCSMDTRFNSFYTDELHPFLHAMNTVLGSIGQQSSIPYLLKGLISNQKQEVANARHTQAEICAQIVAERRKNPSDAKDLLNAMIYGKDPKTGETMSDQLIAVNMVVFLVAGHETTSGLLSFAFYEMLRNPSTYYAAREEVDRVVGKRKITVHDLKDLKYINGVMRETLRLHPSLPAITRSMRADNNRAFEVLGGKYRIDRNMGVTGLFPCIQTDPKVYGADAMEFKPERMMDGEFEKLPAGAWSPFGAGLRACIGRAFAWQEALLVIALIFQNFDCTMDDSSYELKIKQNLTIKPDEFYMRTRLRKGITATSLQQALNTGGTQAGAAQAAEKAADDADAEDAKANLQVYYGSNTGTCEAFAHKLASQASHHGFHASVGTLDSAAGRLSSDVPAVIIGCSYDGQPPDNAGQFVAWLEGLPSDKQLEGLNYAVFGAGHSDWTKTFQRIPRLIDDGLARVGATHITERGESDASQGSMGEDFEAWMDNKLWPALHEKFGGKADAGPTTANKEIKVDVSTESRASQLRQDVHPGTVVDAYTLTQKGQPEKRHLEIHLPEGTKYSAGDYLAVLPLNSDAAIRQVTKKFALPLDATVTISGVGLDHLPLDHPVSVSDLLRSYVELAQPATKDNLKQVISACTSSDEKKVLEGYASKYDESIMKSRRSVLELLSEAPSAQLSFPSFLRMLPPLRTRYYSISSSPLHDPETCTISYGVLAADHLSGHGHFEGVAGSYLSTLTPGDQIQCSVRSTNKHFHLPADADVTPVVMFAAGTGLAPFRGFCQERSVQLAASPTRKLAPAVLFVGCRSSTADRLYGDQFDEWVRQGVVEVHYAFSAEPEKSGGAKHIGQLVSAQEERLRELFRAGARFFTCGSPGVAADVNHAIREIVGHVVKEQGKQGTEKQVDELMEQWGQERFVADVFR